MMGSNPGYLLKHFLLYYEIDQNQQFLIKHPVQEQWGCKTTYATVAGQAEVIDKDCIAVPQDKINAETECTSLDDRKVTKIHQFFQKTFCKYKYSDRLHRPVQTLSI